MLLTFDVSRLSVAYPGPTVYLHTSQAITYLPRPTGLAGRHVVLNVSVREYVFYVFFSDFKKYDFLRFFEMTYQKVVKSL